MCFGRQLSGKPVVGKSNSSAVHNVCGWSACSSFISLLTVFPSSVLGGRGVGLVRVRVVGGELCVSVVEFCTFLTWTDSHRGNATGCRVNVPGPFPLRTDHHGSAVLFKVCFVVSPVSQCVPVLIVASYSLVV